MQLFNLVKFYELTNGIACIKTEEASLGTQEIHSKGILLHKSMGYIHTQAI